MSFILYTECLSCGSTWSFDHDWCKKCGTNEWLISHQESPDHYE